MTAKLALSLPVSRLARTWTAALVPMVLASCSSAPARVTQPSINASRAGSLAMDEYDTNGDGVVAGDELEKAPSLKSALASADTNGDKGLSAEEITARIKKWQAMPIGITSFGFTATLDGKPLEGATVTFEPEAFLGDSVKPAISMTDVLGSGGPTIPKDQRPTPTSPPGVHMGFYRVKISKVVDGKEAIPAKYNESTILGQLVAPDVSEIINRRLVYALTTK